MELRLLLARLPPELRALVYSYTLADGSGATNAGLSFQNKTYDLSHTLVELTPVHYGNPNLLALQRYHFLEGEEYAHWILRNGVQLRIKVVFKGHLNTFVQEHWDKKIATHLRNLAKKHPWLHKVTDYDIRIAWNPTAWAPSKKAKRIGAISKRMIEVLTHEMDADLKARRGHVKTEFHIADFLVCDYVRKSQVLGLRDIVWGTDLHCASQIREVSIAVNSEQLIRPKTAARQLPSHLEAIPETIVKKRFGEWHDSTKLISVFRREVRTGHNEWKRSEAKEEDEAVFTSQAFLAVAWEISRFGEA
ncbi:hypothetical protein N0V90_013170 [Kalmusia sp. IMI 367209]|nr:hypothetical protein N0V90_013170 [Kalmusia sp. IMI 367209]